MGQPAHRPQIVIEQPPLLGTAREVELLTAAIARDPGNHAARARLAGRLVKLDQFDAALAVAARGPGGDASLILILHQCRALFALDRVEQALQLLEDLLDRVWPAQDRARLLAERAKARQRLGDGAAAQADLRAALALDPTSAAAFKRLVNHQLRSGDLPAAADLVDQLRGQGVAHCRLLAAAALIEAGQGRCAAAHALLGQDWLPPVPPLKIPDPWPDAAALHAAAAAELLADPSLRQDRHGTASLHTARVDHPGRADAPALTALLAAIAGASANWIEQLPHLDHPWLALRPPRLALRSWCVITGPDGWEQWHMHPDGWLSGGYYLDVPRAVSAGTDAAGCLAFGMPPGLIGAAAAQAFGENRVRPVPGLLTLFPSHAYHRTYAHERPEPGARRICLAFDLIPA